jgi:chorismate dehydratase
MKHLWNKEVSWVTEGEADAFIEIGDRTFGKKAQYAFSYDLSECWYSLTQLPFVFAAWVSAEKLPTHFLSLFNEALAFGLQNRDVVIESLVKENLSIDVRAYLTQSIDYQFDAQKRLGLNTFLELARAL